MLKLGEAEYVNITAQLQDLLLHIWHKINNDSVNLYDSSNNEFDNA